MRSGKGQNGFTLLEMMFACFVMSIIMAGIFGTVIAVMKNDRRSSVEAELYAAASRAVERVQRGGDGLAGLMKAREASVSIGAAGATVDFDVDQNNPYTASTADDTQMSVYVLDVDGVPATVEDDQLIMDPDVTAPSDEMILCEGVADLNFSKNDRLITMTIELERSVRGQPIRVNSQQDIYLRN